MSDNKQKDWWQHPAIVVSALLSLGFMISAIAGCEAKNSVSYYKAQQENNKERIAYDKWLLENGHIDKPRIR